jgi:hypothetical protein
MRANVVAAVTPDHGDIGLRLGVVASDKRHLYPYVKVGSENLAKRLYYVANGGGVPGVLGPHAHEVSLQKLDSFFRREDTCRDESIELLARPTLERNRVHLVSPRRSGLTQSYYAWLRAR